MPFSRPILTFSPGGQMLTPLVSPRDPSLHQLFVHVAIQRPLWCAYSLAGWGLMKTSPSPSFPGPHHRSEQPKYTYCPPFIFPYKLASSGYTERKLFWARGSNSWLLRNLAQTWFHILARLQAFPICILGMSAVQTTVPVWPALRTQKYARIN